MGWLVLCRRATESGAGVPLGCPHQLDSACRRRNFEQKLRVCGPASLCDGLPELTGCEHLRCACVTTGVQRRVHHIDYSGDRPCFA